MLNNISEEEIIKELHDQGVTNVHKFSKIIDGKSVPSGVLLLSFDTYNLPSNINIAWGKYKVRQHFPTPMRCKNCQLLGHTAKYCKNVAICNNCNLPPHSSDCIRTFCANCSGNHPASSKDCPKFVQAKEILQIKTINKCSLKDATKKYNDNIPKPIFSECSYSSVASLNIEKYTNKPKNKTINVQNSNSSHIESNGTASGTSISKTNKNSHAMINEIHSLSSPNYLSNYNNSTHNSSNKIKNSQSSSTISTILNNDDSNMELTDESFSQVNFYQPLPSLHKTLSSTSLNISENSDT